MILTPYEDGYMSGLLGRAPKVQPDSETASDYCRAYTDGANDAIDAMADAERRLKAKATEHQP